MDREPLLAHLLELDAEGRHASLRLYVQEQIDSWGPAVFEAVAVAQWDAGDETERWAAEEQRRGLPGLGPLPESLERGIEEGRERAATAVGWEGLDQECTGGDSDSTLAPQGQGLEGLEDGEVTRRAEETMLRWEAYQRIEDVVFAQVALRVSSELDPAWVEARLGGAVVALVGGDRPDGAIGRSQAITGIALGQRLLERGSSDAELVVKGLASAGERDPSALPRAAAALLAGRVKRETGCGEEAVRTFSGVAAEEGGGRWATRALCSLCGTVRDMRGAVQAFGIIADGPSQARVDRDRRALASALGETAILHKEAGSVDRARELHEAAIGIYREVGNRRGEGIALGDLALLQNKTGAVDRARELHDAALEIAREVGSRRSEGMALGNLGILHHETGSFDRAREIYEAAIEIKRETGGQQAAGMDLGNLGALHHETGSAERAKELYETALHIHREAGDRPREASVLGNLGILYMETGSPDRARAYYEAALEIHREVGNRSREGIVLGNLGILHNETGSAERAKELYETALDIHREAGDRRAEGIVLAGLGGLHRDTGSPDRARELYEAALEVHREVGDRRTEGITLGNLGNLHRQTGSPERAMELYEAALELRREVGDRRAEGELLGSLANLDLDLGRPASALEHADAACRILSDVGDLNELRKPQHTLARCLARTGSDEGARAAFRSAIETLEKWLRGIGSDLHRARVLEDALPLFSDALSFLLRNDPPAPNEGAEAFQVAERCKARSLLESVRSREIATAISPELAERRAHVEVRLRALQDALLRERSRAEPRQGVLGYIEKELGPVRREHAELLDDIASRFPACAAHEGLTAPIRLEAAQARVVASSDAALLEYFVTKKETFLWVIRRERVEVVRLGMGEEELEMRVATGLGPVRRFCETRQVTALLPLLPERLHTLANAVLGPALPHLEGVQRLLIVPSGALYEIPFEMLVLGRQEARSGGTTDGAPDHFARAEFVADRFEVAYGPSATLLDPELVAVREPPCTAAPAAPNPESTTGTALSDPAIFALGDPVYEALQGEPSLSRSEGGEARFGRLPGTREEVRALKGLFTNVRALMRSRARESAYRRHAPSADIVHLGCHGVIDADQPAYSGVVLSPGTRRDEDAFLQAYEIARVHLERRPLVVVSACEVAGGRLSSAEGLLGLTRSFAEAGAGSVVASTWPVDDAATARLMTHFYKAIATGEADPVAALAGAKRAMLAEARKPAGSQERRSGSSQSPLPPAHPYYWAGFGIHGISALGGGR